MSARWLFAGIGLLAAAAGAALWWAMRLPAADARAIPEISPAALSAATFAGPDGRRHSIGEFHGKVVVLNFWATWCAPCREEMPLFERLQREWDGRVQFVGLSDDEAAKVGQFARDHGISYPLWTGGEEVGELSRRLGNRVAVLPFSVILDRSGAPVSMKVGTYPEAELRQEIRDNGR